MAWPSSFITLRAGLALLGAIATSLAGAMAEAATREAALIAFLASAANITLLGIGGAFWGLMIGLLAALILNPRRRSQPLADRLHAESDRMKMRPGRSF